MDLTARAVETLGEVLVHGVAMKPGKPTVIGRIGAVPVFGLPGHPAACFFVTETLVRACIGVLAGAPLPRSSVTARLSENVSSNHGREEYLCVSLRAGTAVPVYGKSGVVSQLSAADGYLCVPRDCEGLRAGAEVTVYLLQRGI
jgi:molybdopterin molybdotransferase